MAVRTIDDMLAQLLRFLPDQYAAASDALSGLAAQMVQAEQAGEDLVLSTTVGAAAGKWLTLMAGGYGVYRQAGESDASLRIRLRRVEDRVTRPAILAVVNALLSAYTATQAVMYEHFASGFFVGDFSDQPDDAIRLYGQHNAFTLLVPALTADASSYGAFALDPSGAYGLDTAYVDADAFAVGNTADDTEHAVYAAIQAAVERLRAAGVRWWLLRDDP